MDESLETYLAGLISTSQQALTDHAVETARTQKVEAEAYARRMTPLVDRLRRIVDAMPEGVREQPHSIEFFAQALKGRQRPTPHRGELAAALRSLGFSRTRCWRKAAGGFRSTWQLKESG